MAEDGALLKGGKGRVQLSGDIRGRAGHKGLQQGCADGNGFHQVVQNGGQAVLLRLVLGQNPGLRLVDILVAALEEGENFRHGVRHAQVLHLRRRLRVRSGDHRLQVLIHGLRRALIADHAAEILVAHGNGAVHQIAQGVGQIGIDPVCQKLPADHAVVFKGHLMQHEVAHRVHTEEIHQIVRVHHVSLRLAHLAVALQKPGMAENLLRQRLAQRHQEDGPVDRVETDDILSDQVQVGGPQLLILLAAVSVRVIADTGDVVGQRVQPHIDHMPVVEIHGNAPLEGGSGHAQILQTGKQEVVHHFVFAGHGLNELRMFIDMPDQPVRILAHLKKVSLFLRGLHLASAVGALSVHQLGLGPEGFAGRAVQSFVIAFVNIALVIQLFENLLHLLYVRRVRGADELVVGGSHQIPQTLHLARHFIHIFLGGHARLFGLQLDLLTVLIRSGLEEHIVAVLSLEPGDAVRQHGLIGVADMGLAGGVGNGRGDIIFSFHLYAHFLAPSVFFVCPAFFFAGRDLHNKSPSSPILSFC